MKKGRAALVATTAAVASAVALLLAASPPATLLPAPVDPPPPDPPAPALELDPHSDPFPLPAGDASDPVAASEPAWDRPIDASDPPPSAPPTYASSVNEFAFDLYRAVSAGEDGKTNLFFSPVSIHTAFSVLYEGARGSTAQQLRDAFRFEPGPAARHAAAAAAAASIGRGDGHSDLSLANALWAADWFAPYDSYLETARGAYGATVDTVDFVDEGDAVPRINAWASDNTGGRIPQVISPDSVDGSTAMVITNAIYFKGYWATRFPEGGTSGGPFTAGDGTTAPADFMRVTGEFGHAALDGYQVLRMPYEGGRLSMLVVLPDQPDGLGQVAAAFSSRTAGEWIGGMDSREVAVALPKFEIRTSYDLKPHLGSMGASDVFGGAADLSGIGQGALFVSDAVHAAFVSVDEEGTEAAAGTGIAVATTLPPPPIEFTADRPFMFVIHDGETGAILFMGRVADPPAPR